MTVVSAKRSSAAKKHAHRVRTCVCGKICRGNGGWSSHKRACQEYRDAFLRRTSTKAKA